MICKADVCLQTIIIKTTLQKNKKPFRKICQTKTLSDSDPDLTSSSLVTFGPNFDCILLHIQNVTSELLVRSGSESERVLV
jgi:hypothetical protein